jgi:hypothetical protein
MQLNLFFPWNGHWNYIEQRNSNIFLFKSFHGFRRKKTYLYTLLEKHLILILILLVLGSWLKQGLTKVRAKSQARELHFMFSKAWKVWGNELPHSQVSSHFGSWSPNRLPNFQITIARVKTRWIKELHISLERSWNVYI